jgi:hypothetical protein
MGPLPNHPALASNNMHMPRMQSDACCSTMHKTGNIGTCFLCEVWYRVMMIPDPSHAKLVAHAYQAGYTFAACMPIGQTVLKDICTYILPRCNIDNIALQGQ